MGDDDLLVCAYEAEGQRKFRGMLDTYEMTHPNGLWYNDEKRFLQVFLDNLNNSLDKAHSDGDAGSEDVKERLIALVVNGLTFDGKHVKIA